MGWSLLSVGGWKADILTILGTSFIPWVHTKGSRNMMLLRRVLEGSLKQVFLRRVLRRRLQGLEQGQRFLEGFLEGGVS